MWKAYVPIIAVCAATFAVSFAAGLWWELSQQDEWQTSASSARNVKQSIAQRRTDNEKSDQESKTDDEKDEPAKAEQSEEDSESPPDEVTPEPGDMPNVSQPAVPSNAIRVRGGMRRRDLSTLSEEQRARLFEMRRRTLETTSRDRAHTTSSGEISGESDSSITVIDETETIIAEPDN